jgi:solute carrier family 50 protein (sugar transporter)
MSSTADILTKTVAPALGAVLSNLLYLGPLSAHLAARRTGELGPLNPLLSSFILANTVGCVSFGFVLRDPYVLYSNLPGLYVALFYTLVVHRVVSSSALARKIELIVTFWGVFWGVINSVVLFADNHDLAVALTGWGCFTTSLFMFGVPLTVVRTVVTTKDTSLINRGFLVMQIVNCSMWTIYGIFTSNLVIILGNAIGLVLGLLQAGLVMAFPREIAARPAPRPQAQPAVLKEVNAAAGTSSFIGATSFRNDAATAEPLVLTTEQQQQQQQRGQGDAQAQQGTPSHHVSPASVMRA